MRCRHIIIYVFALKVHILTILLRLNPVLAKMIYDTGSMLFRSFLQRSPPPTTADLMSWEKFRLLPPWLQKALADRLNSEEGQSVWASGQAMLAGQTNHVIRTYSEGGGMYCARVNVVGCALCGAECVKPIERDPLAKALFAKLFPARSLLCSRCESVRYCSEACQKAHWSTHRIDCK